MTSGVIDSTRTVSKNGLPFARKERAMNLPAIERMIDQHLAAYCDADPARRAVAIREIWTADGRLVDPPLEARGHQGIADQAATLLSQFPQHRFERSTPVDAHHGFLRYGWRLLGPDGAKVLEGVDFAEQDVDGRLARVVGFFGAQAAAA